MLWNISQQIKISAAPFPKTKEHLLPGSTYVKSKTRQKQPGVIKVRILGWRGLLNEKGFDRIFLGDKNMDSTKDVREKILS